MTVEELNEELRNMLDEIAAERGPCTVAIRGAQVRAKFGGSSSNAARALKRAGFWWCEGSLRWFANAGREFVEIADDGATPGT